MIEEGPGTILIFDEAESQAATQAQMAQTARRFGLGGYDPSVPQTIGMTPPQAVTYAPPPMQPPLIIEPQTGHYMTVGAAAAGHLLITPSSRQGLIRLIRMQGPTKLESWTLHQDAAPIVIAMLTAFGITWSDLRESEEE